MTDSPFQAIQIRKPSDEIIVQIRNLISGGTLKPGDRLPPERVLQDQFKVGRGHIREAIRKLEFYGILTTKPQSGTYIAGLGIRSLEGLITNILQLSQDDTKGLIETRLLLETQAARLCAERASENDLREIERCHREFDRKIRSGESGIEEDLIFHLTISRCCGNRVLNALISILAPDIIRLSRERNTCRDGRAAEALAEHRRITRAITGREGPEAESAMADHLKKTLELFQEPRKEAP